MKRKLGFVATVVLLSGFVSTNAFAAGGGGPASGQAGVIAGSAGVGALAVGRGGVGLIAGSPRPFISLIAPGNVGASPSGTGALPSSIGASPSSIGALPIGQGLGRGAGSSGPIISLMPRSTVIYSVPLSTGASFSFSNLYSTPFNSSQPAAPQANIGSNAAPSQNGQGGTANGATITSVAGGGTQVSQICGDLAGSMTDVLLDQLRQILHLANDQQAELDRFKAAFSEVKNVVAAACLTNPSASPIDRLEAAAKQSGAIIRVAQILRPPLETLYPSRTDDQKLSLKNADPQPQNASLPRAQDQRNENRTNLQVGARVRLRSGGPLMSVLSVSGTDVTCVWFDVFRRAETGTFPAASLM
jgi:uncharacterized protein YodC (DUF2158 family)